MDILLTHGYFLANDPHESKVMKPYPPLGILSLSAYLKQHGFDVGVFDTTFDSIEGFRAVLSHEGPKAVGIYGTLMTRSGVLQIMAEARAAGASVILGGPEPAGYFAEYINHGADVVVFGEGEVALEEIIPRLTKSGAHRLDGIAGIAYRRDDGEICRTAARPAISDLDSLPTPDREAIDVAQYFQTWRKHHGVTSISLICARGCPYRCEWCSHAVYGHSHRRRSPEHVASEVDQLVERYRPDQLWYADDVFTIHQGWLSAYARELRRRSLRVPFECISRADRLNADAVDLLADMGCKRLWIGSESGSQRILDAMRRDVRVEQVRAATRALKERGIQTGMFIMLGYEGEEEVDLEATIEHLKKAAPDVFYTTVAYPIKGTEYHNKVRDRIVAPGAWETTTDRSLDIRGRHSRRYYSFATRWMVNSVALHTARYRGGGWLEIARAAAYILLARTGMLLTRNENSWTRSAGAGWAQ